MSATTNNSNKADTDSDRDQRPQVDMSIISRLKTDPNGRCFHSLGADGVVRVWHFDTWEVIDAVGLSPEQIKEWLDRRPFDQAVEDKFRGVDGCNVSRKNMFDPPSDIVPERPSKEFVEKHFQAFEERKRSGKLKDPDAPSCTLRRSSYNLDPV